MLEEVLPSRSFDAGGFLSAPAVALTYGRKATGRSNKTVNRVKTLEGNMLQKVGLGVENGLKKGPTGQSI